MPPTCKTPALPAPGKKSRKGFAAGMVNDLILLPEAERDIDEAAAWYDGRRAGLGAEFLRRVEACLQAIRQTPQMHRFIHEHYRRGLVKKFPYAIFYEYEGN